LYLWQQPFLVMDGPLDWMAVRLPLAFIAASLSYRFVEQPALRLFARKTGKPTEAPARVQAVAET